MKSQASKLETKASEIMVTPVLVIKAEWSLADAARFLLSNRISGAAVIGQMGKPIGVLTLKDIARYAMVHLKIEEVSDDLTYFLDPGLKTGADEYTEEKSGFHFGGMKDITVENVMTPGIKSLPEKSTLREVLDLMFKYHIHRVFLSDSKGKLAGVVTTFDMMLWMKQNA